MMISGLIIINQMKEIAIFIVLGCLLLYVLESSFEVKQTFFKYILLGLTVMLLFVAILSRRLLKNVRSLNP